MPVCTLILVTLSTTLPSFLSALSSLPTKPLTIARAIRWVIEPTTISTHLLATKWDLLLVLPQDVTLPPNITALIKSSWTVKVGIPSRLLTSYAQTNEALLHPRPGSVPALSKSSSSNPNQPLVADSAQNLELSPELQSWVRDFGGEDSGAVSMLNLLSFKPGMKDSYLQYGKAFSESIGSKRGGLAKIVGKVVSVDGEEKTDWDEVAIAHYPSIAHFADMLGSEDYQAVNKKSRVPALRDTFILCTSELNLPWGEGQGKESKL